MMAEQPAVHVGGASPEEVAYKMTFTIFQVLEGRKIGEVTREEFLNTYAACIHAMRNPDIRVIAEKRKNQGQN
jgi:hypothetical protein